MTTIEGWRGRGGVVGGGGGGQALGPALFNKSECSG